MGGLITIVIGGRHLIKNVENIGGMYGTYRSVVVYEISGQQNLGGEIINCWGINNYSDWRTASH